MLFKKYTFPTQEKSYASFKKMILQKEYAFLEMTINCNCHSILSQIILNPMYRFSLWIWK